MSARGGSIGRPVALAVTALVYLFMVIPIAVVFMLAFNPSEYGGFPMRGLTLRWFAELFDDSAIIDALKTSLLLGCLTSLISTAIGVGAAFAIVRYRFRGRHVLNTLLTMPILIPHVALGVGLLLLLQWLGWSKSLGLLLAGHVALTLPFVLLVTQTRLHSISRSYEEAALTLGANALQTFWQITLPLMLPAVSAGMIFAFTMSFDEVTATMFWRPANVETVPTQILAMLQTSVSQKINALAVFMIVVTTCLPLSSIALGRVLSRAIQGRRGDPAEPSLAAPAKTIGMR